MTLQELQERCAAYKEYKRLAEEAAAVADSVGDELKAAMLEMQETKIIAGPFKITYNEVSRTDIDKKRLEAEQEAIYNSYLKKSSYMRLLVS
jgi:predicted phage-related endonuclease